MSSTRSSLVLAALAAGALLFAPLPRTAAQPGGSKPSAGRKAQEGKAKEKKDGKEEPELLAVVGARIHTGTGTVIPRATLLVKDGKVEGVGADLFVPERAERIEAEGLHLCPGVVAMRLSGVGLSGRSKSYADVLNPFDFRIRYALAAGITSSVEGSSTSRNCVIKMTYGSLEKMLVAEGTRVGMSASSLASTRRKSREKVRKMVGEFRRWKQEYRAWRARVAGGDKQAKEPKTPKSVADLARVYKGEAVLWIERPSRREQIGPVLDFLHRVNLPAVLNGPTEGWSLAAEIGRARCLALVSPRTFRPRDEKAMEPEGSNIRIAAILHEAGVPVACFPGRSRFGGGGLGFSGLFGRDMHTPFMEPAFAVRGGLDQEAALASVTRVPALMAGVEHRVGTLEKGKDADFILVNGHPLHYQALVERTFIDGECLYDRSQEPIYRDVPRRAPGPR